MEGSADVDGLRALTHEEDLRSLPCCDLPVRKSTVRHVNEGATKGLKKGSTVEERSITIND